MDLGVVLAVLGAGFGAGFFATAIGAGSLVSFPILLAIGISPIVANVSNTVGMVPGGVSGSWGFRRELEGRRHLILRVVATSLVGGLGGALLLLALPPDSFSTVVPFLVIFAASLVGIQPLVTKGLRRRTARRDVVPVHRETMGPVLTGMSGVVGVYGGYFGAGQGVALVAVLGLGLDVPLSVINGLKTVAILCANIAATLVFVFIAPLEWTVVLLISIGSVLGGWIGAHVGRRLPPVLFRTLVVLFGYVVGLRLLLA